MDWGQRRRVQWVSENEGVDDFFEGVCIKEAGG